MKKLTPKTSTHSELNVRSIPLHQIEQNENSRLTYDQAELTQLMVSMKQTGLFQPIGVNRMDTDRYEVIFENRRFVAAKKLGWKTIDCTVFETADEESNMLSNASENMVRADVSLPEQGRIFYLLTQRGMTLGEIAARAAVPKSRVASALNAFQAVPVKFRNKITHNERGGKTGGISGTSAMKITGMAKNAGVSKENVEKIMDFAIQHELPLASIKKVAELVSRGLPVQESLDLADSIKPISIDFFMKKSVVAKLETEYKTTIRQIVLGLLKTHKELDIE